MLHYKSQKPHPAISLATSYHHPSRGLKHCFRYLLRCLLIRWIFKKCLIAPFHGCHVWSINHGVSVLFSRLPADVWTKFSGINRTGLNQRQGETSESLVFHHSLCFLIAFCFLWSFLNSSLSFLGIPVAFYSFSILFLRRVCQEGK